MQPSRDRFLQEGYLVLRNVVPPSALDALRESYEILVSRQRAVWAGERRPEDPPGGVQTHLSAGDGVIYILPLLHWGSNYSARMRRTIHGGFSTHTQYPGLSFTQRLSSAARATFERWGQRSAQMQDHTAAALRAVIQKDGAAYRASLERLHPGRGEKGGMLTTVFLCKAAQFIHLKKNPDHPGVPDDLRRRAAGSHAITLNWGPEFADRFSKAEAEALWKRFQPLDARLLAGETHFSPGFQSGPMRYYFNEMPDRFGVKDFIAGWGDAPTAVSSV